MKVYLYGKLGSALGPQLDVRIQTPCSVGSVRRHLVATYPEVGDVLRDNRVKTLVGEMLVGDDHTLSADDQVEFLAPVSGG